MLANNYFKFNQMHLGKFMYETKYGSMTTLTKLGDVS